jgi:threonine dehydrogenase-like Zn-dependent dehydrogenase
VTDGPKPGLVRDLGASYHTGDVKAACEGADIVIECTGVSRLVFDAMACTGSNGIACLTGVSSGGRDLSVDLGELNRSMVLENDVVFGSVNANRRHYEAAAASLARADHGWLDRLITHRLPLDRWEAALTRGPKDVKSVLDLGE